MSVVIESKRFERSGGRKGKAAATLLVELASEAQLFHTGERETFATIPVESHYENWPLKSLPFKQWLSRKHYMCYGSVPRSQALSEALLVLEAVQKAEG